ncbi:MAG: penicillin-binding protein [Acidobacteria bacterium]|nr:MAG: penicillin-binding protein [Acidobacteriota bacterium]
MRDPSMNDPKTTSPRGRRASDGRPSGSPKDLAQRALSVGEPKAVSSSTDRAATWLRRVHRRTRRLGRLARRRAQRLRLRSAPTISTLGRRWRSVERSPLVSRGFFALVAASALALLAGALAVRVYLPSPQRALALRPVTSTVLSAPIELATGGRLDAAAIEQLLIASGLRSTSSRAITGRHSEAETAALPAPAPGWYERTALDEGGESGEVALTYRVHWPGVGLLDLALAEGRLERLHLDERELDRLHLPRVELDRLLGSGMIDRRPVTYEQIPEHLVRAVLAAEDDQYFFHHGIALGGILRAARSNFAAGRIVQGASTITQQLARNLFLTAERSWSRKLHEARLAIALDLRWSKEKILAAYLNEVYLGSRWSRQLVGVGAAANAYFGVEPEQLSVAEAALLAGMIASPARFDPVRRPDDAMARRDRVLDRMHSLGWLDSDQLRRAAAEPIVLRADHRPLWTSHFVRASLTELANDYLDTGSAAEASVVDSGLRLHSTLDWFEQAAAIAALERSVESGRIAASTEAALVSLEPTSGLVRAYVGGRPDRRSAFDRAGSARRQIGSLAKPFAYAAAFEAGVAAPNATVLDLPIEVRFAGQSWRPANHGGAFHGTVTVAESLRRSLNAASLRIALAAGLDNVATTLHHAGLEPKVKGPSLALGAVEGSPLQVTSAYSLLANGGVRSRPRFLAAVFDRHGTPLERRRPAGEEPGAEAGLSAESAALVTAMLQDTVRRGTAWRVGRELKGPLAGKTGTSNDGRDAWFVGYSRERVVTVWLGRDDFSETSMTGGSAAAPVWATFAERIEPSNGFTQLPAPRSLADLDRTCTVQRWLRAGESGRPIWAAQVSEGQVVRADRPVSSDQQVNAEATDGGCPLIGTGRAPSLESRSAVTASLVARERQQLREEQDSGKPRGAAARRAGGLAEADGRDRPGLVSANPWLTLAASQVRRSRGTASTSQGATARHTGGPAAPPARSDQPASNPGSELTELSVVLTSGWQAPEEDSPEAVTSQPPLLEVYGLTGRLGRIVEHHWVVPTAETSSRPIPTASMAGTASMP